MANTGTTSSRTRPARDMLAVEAVDGAGIHLASFDLDALRAYRSAETMGNAFRRPAAYRSLTDAQIADIFVRVDRLRPPARCLA